MFVDLNSVCTNAFSVSNPCSRREAWDKLVLLIFLQNFSVHQILWSLCLVVIHALTLKLPIQTSHSVAPRLQVCVRSGEKCQKFRKTSTTLAK